MTTHAVVVIECDIEDDASQNWLAAVVEPLHHRLKEGIPGVVPRETFVGIHEIADAVVKVFKDPPT